MPHPRQRRGRHPHHRNMRQAGSKAQPKCDPHQHDGWLKRWSSQDHPPIGSRPHRAQPAPPSATTAAATPACIVLQDADPCLAASGTSCQTRRDASNWLQQRPEAHHAKPPWAEHDELCWPIPSSRICDAAWTAANGGRILSTPSTTWVLLTGRGREL